MLITFLLTLLIVALCVAIHYEVLYRLANFLEALAHSPRQQMVLGVTLALAAHVVEIYLFACGYYFALNYAGIGHFSGEVAVEDFLDCTYLSFVTYSTLGFGDIVPRGWIRFMVGTEAMTGLVQLAWTASYLYLKMETNWVGINRPANAGKG